MEMNVKPDVAYGVNAAKSLIDPTKRIVWIDPGSLSKTDEEKDQEQETGRVDLTTGTQYHLDIEQGWREQGWPHPMK